MSDQATEAEKKLDRIIESFERKGKRKGALQFSGATPLELERMSMLRNAKTYAEAASRLGIKETTLKQTIYRLDRRYIAAKAFTNAVEKWRIERRNLKRGTKP